MTDGPFLFTDGGPLIVLPAGAAAWWDGAGDHGNSLMAGGTVETGYDVACSVDAGSVVTIRDTDVLVGTDGEFGGALLLVEGRLLLIQGLPDDLDLRTCVRRALSGEPDALVAMCIGEHGLLLLGGADGGGGDVWGRREARIARLGSRVLRVFHGPEVELIVDLGEP